MATLTLKLQTLMQICFPSTLNKTCL